MGLISHPVNEVTGLVIGAAVAVHRGLGPGLLESAYQVCLGHQFTLQGIEHGVQVPVPVVYNGTRLDCGYRLLPIHEAQVLTYLRLTARPAALLLNFNVRSMRLGIRRVLG